ncbi:MAG: septum site-determining protein MinC [Sulfobacillus sp.]
MARQSKESTNSRDVPAASETKPTTKRRIRRTGNQDRTEPSEPAKPFVERLLERKSARDWEDEARSHPTLLIRRTLRSGQNVRFYGNVVVLGDVNPGAEITAGGDIIVMGWLRGMAHAGAEGNEKAMVSAFRLNPTQLRIAQYIARGPDAGEALLPEVPEFAEVKDGQLVIDRWQHSVLGSLGR